MIVGGSFYSWLGVANTEDIDLVLGKTRQVLPVIGTEIPTLGFYYAGPLVLLGLFIYFQVYLQRANFDLSLNLLSLVTTAKPLS